mgnify:FL=1
MKSVMRTINVVILALGILGIILGICIGLYRNDRIARLQAVNDLGNQPVGENPIGDYLLDTNLHTLLLAAGTLLTLLSVALFLFDLRKTLN